MKVIGLANFKQQGLQYEISNDLIQKKFFKIPTEKYIYSKEDKSVNKVSGEEPNNVEDKPELKDYNIK